MCVKDMCLKCLPTRVWSSLRTTIQVFRDRSVQLSVEMISSALLGNKMLSRMRHFSAFWFSGAVIIGI